MAKDPAFLFYPGDWMGGTSLFNRSHKGAYMDLLMAQFNNGHMSEDDIRIVLGEDYESMWESKLKAKFKQDENGLFYNERLEEEKVKRSKFTDSRKNNLKSKQTHKRSHMDRHMENENENEIKDLENKGVAEKFKKFYEAYPGAKRKLSTEFAHFLEITPQDRHSSTVNDLLPAVESQIGQKEKIREMGGKTALCPNWMKMANYIKYHGWEEIFLNGEASDHEERSVNGIIRVKVPGGYTYRHKTTGSYATKEQISKWKEKFG